MSIDYYNYFTELYDLGNSLTILKRFQTKVLPLKVKKGLIYALHQENFIKPSSF
jgi:hypothetical protein